MTRKFKSNCNDDRIRVLRQIGEDVFVMVYPGDHEFQGELCWPAPVMHDTGKKVWVTISYSEELPDWILPVGDGTDNGYDQHGTRIVSVPADRCTFYDADEAEAICRCMDADEQLLGYAN